MPAKLVIGAVTAFLALPALAQAPAVAPDTDVAKVAAKDTRGTLVKLPSGAEVRWQETLQDTSGGNGLTYRFRFVMPDLAKRVPATSGPASEDIEDTTDRPPIDIDTETAEVQGGAGDPEVDAPPASGYISDDDTQAVPGDTAAEEAADAMIDDPTTLPAAPEVLAQDPVHDDVIWLCQNWALPRLANPGPRPRQIIISLADKEVPFGAYDPDALQLFESFRLPADRDTCEWEPW